MTDAEIKDFLKKFLVGRWAVLGVGNILRGDDAFGSLVARNLKKALAGTEFEEHIYDGGIAPENYYGKLANKGYERVLIVDAVVFDAPPGEVAIFVPEDFDAVLPATHGPTNFEFLQMMMPSAEIAVLALSPGTVKIGAGVSPKTIQAVKKIVGIFVEILNG